MSAPLPGLMLLPARRELTLMERAVGSLPVEQRAEMLLRFELARKTVTDSLAELATLPLQGIDDWSRRTFRALNHAYLDVIAVLGTPGVVQTLRSELGAQREEVLAFLRPLIVETQADWAFVTLQLALDALLPQVSSASLPARTELERQLAEVDFAGPVGASVRTACFLTLILESARAGEPVGERHARYAALAFLNARTLRDVLASELGVALDPTPFLAVSRGEAAREALLRLLALPRDEAFNQVLDEKIGR